MSLITISRDLETRETDNVVATRVPAVALIHKESDLEVGGGSKEEEKSTAWGRSMFQQTTLLCLAVFVTMLVSYF